MGAFADIIMLPSIIPTCPFEGVGGGGGGVMAYPLGGREGMAWKCNNYTKQYQKYTSAFCSK